MSPQSRGRKQKRSGTDRDGPPGPDLVIARTVRDACRELDRIDDPLMAEMYVSEMLGVWWGLHVIDADPEVIFGEALVAKAATTRKPAALGLLRCLAVLGTERQRRAAAAAADALAAGGVAEPAWAGAVGTGRVTAAWAYGDVYGDQTSVLLAVERAGAEHGVVVLVDHTLGGIAKDAFATPDPSGVLADLRGFAGPLVRVRELSAGQAAAVLSPAFAASDAGPEPPVSEDFAANRALALARVRMLGPEPAAQPVPVVGRAERQMIVNGFLAASAGQDLPEQARRCAELLVEFGTEEDGGRPLRVSPAKLELFLFEWLPAPAELEPGVTEALPATLRAWAGWAAERSGLPDEATEELATAVEELLDAYLDDDAYPDDPDAPGGEDLVAMYLGADIDDIDPELLPDLLARRQFTMPYYGTRIGGDDYPRLDAGDPDERALLIQGEHPEYHAALAGPGSDEGAVNPRLHLAVHEIVATQLWDDNPPEAWQAAQRLLAAGMDRHDVLHAIGEVVTRHLRGALSGTGPADLVAYVADLARLGAAPPPARRR